MVLVEVAVVCAAAVGAYLETQVRIHVSVFVCDKDARLQAV